MTHLGHVGIYRLDLALGLWRWGHWVFDLPPAPGMAATQAHELVIGPLYITWAVDTLPS